MITSAFINNASDILAETNYGLTGSKIAEYCNAYAVDYGVDIPYSEYPFPDAPNKRTALRENLKCFEPEQQYTIIKELCELDKLKEAEGVRELKLKLISQYSSEFGSSESGVEEVLVKGTRHWLNDYPESLALYEQALLKHQNKVFERNLLDDLRLSLELLLKKVLGNDKSLENQLPHIGQFFKSKGCSKELTNMFMKLLDYYAKYNNEYVKHSDSIKDTEIDFLFELTSSFMRLMIRL